ncbi:MAG TPA: hypothetical protein VIS72_14105, partial [Anaerolineales bacterium]
DEDGVYYLMFPVPLSVVNQNAPNKACTDEVGSQGCRKKEITKSARERKNSNTSPSLLQSCVKALTRVV